MKSQIINRGRKSANYTVTAPIGGLNRRDNLDAMPENEAYVMDNYYPAETKVCLRGGYRAYALNDSAVKVQTLMEFHHQSGDRLFACGNGKIWDVSSQEEAVKLAENKNADDWQYVQFKERLIACNGYDDPLTYYEKSSGERVFEPLNVTGDNLNPKLLVNVAMSKQRLFFVEKNSLKCWYSENAGEMQGKLLLLDFSSLVTRGGHLQAVAGWTVDGGQGIDDLTVFLTSEGEALIYQGSNPSDASNWQLKGKYYVSKPIGYRCTLQYEGDVVIICEDGYVPLGKALPLAQSTTGDVAYSDKIRGLVLERVKNNRNRKGWQGIIYPRGGYALFNVPVYEQFEQHVVNMSSGAWCRFTGIRALCWGMLAGRLYFGSDSGVYLFDEGYSDNGLAVCGEVKQAYCNLGSANLKKIQLINPRTKSSTKFALCVYTDMDFADREYDYTESIGHTASSVWGTGNHGMQWSSLQHPSGAKWATLKGSIRSQWICNSASGFKASVVFKTKTRGNLIEWYNTGIIYEQGSGIL